jgi:hypothetical protein
MPKATRISRKPLLLLFASVAVLALVVAVVLVLSMMGVIGEERAHYPTETQEIVMEKKGTGEKTFTFKYANAYGITPDPSKILIWHIYEISTDKETVGEALLDLGMIDGDKTDFGLMVTVVCGEAVHYEENKLWWKFLIDGEMASVGVDATPIEEGKVYAFECVKD